MTEKIKKIAEMRKKRKRRWETVRDNKEGTVIEK